MRLDTYQEPYTSWNPGPQGYAQAASHLRIVAQHSSIDPWAASTKKIETLEERVELLTVLVHNLLVELSQL